MSSIRSGPRRRGEEHRAARKLLLVAQLGRELVAVVVGFEAGPEFDLRAALEGARLSHSIELSLTPQGRVLHQRVGAARESMLELGRGLIEENDLTPAIDLLRDLLRYSAFAELVERRRQLLEGQAHGQEHASERPDRQS